MKISENQVLACLLICDVGPAVGGADSANTVTGLGSAQLK